jgi:hypothetical protein
MNCENCQELLSEFLDESLGFAERSEIEVHLQDCPSCFSVHRELVSILNFCETSRGDYDSPPNPQALWLRISNLIESEQQLAIEPLAEGKRKSFWNRLSNYTLNFSLPQLVSSVVAVAIVAALITVAGLRGIGSQDANENNITVAGSYSGNIEERLQKKQQVIDYWNQRVEQRKAQWDRKTREAFERNLQILDETVAQYKDALLKNPHDDVYEEALNSAINEKLEFLKEFSEL